MKAKLAKLKSENDALRSQIHKLRGESSVLKKDLVVLQELVYQMECENRNLMLLHAYPRPEEKVFLN